MKKILTFLWLLIQVLVFPIALIKLLINVYQYNKYRKIIVRVVNNNDELFTYLETLEFGVDWIGRLYSVQVIPEQLRDFSDDELYDMTMRSLLPLNKLLERSILIDVCGVIIDRINETSYIVCITPYNYPKMIKSFWVLLTSFIITSGTVIGLYLTNIF